MQEIIQDYLFHLMILRSSAGDIFSKFILMSSDCVFSTGLYHALSRTSLLAHSLTAAGVFLFCTSSIITLAAMVALSIRYSITLCFFKFSDAIAAAVVHSFLFMLYAFCADSAQFPVFIYSSAKIFCFLVIFNQGTIAFVSHFFI